MTAHATPASSTSAVASMIEALCTARRNAILADASAFANDALQSEADAYTVQCGVAQTLGHFATPVPRHWKSGGANRASVITHAPLPDAGIWTSPANAGAWPFPLHHRLIEGEIALRLGQDVTAEQAANMTPETAHEFIDAMTVSIEMVDSRWAQPLNDLPPLLKLADMGVHGALVLGDWVPYQRRDWSAQRCVVRVGASPEQVFVGTHSLGDPAWLLPQWVRHVVDWGDGVVVPAGTVVTTGNWVGAVVGVVGDVVEVGFDGVGFVRLVL
ncbi:2-keto-4-pentenoate hydratase [Diaphorobacter sp. HDW4A]|uniref:fumarylacetoacetate hydrolase family protein n=1 Tax=Diaphorobacter sp. HDW4A TaxID=2714924 RepID=UPI001408602A|nr:fumarylacetoacetate hydrolase family protein [Diaphorobacter sp. HDW4A]QIL82713.1 2-keto-4-pentenoate hydratase [Diaphorobacter sp. HDW4A]